MKINDYTAYFHDGSIINIEHREHEILISMESSQISPEDLTEEIPLSKESLLKGILHLKNFDKIVVNDQVFPNKLSMLGDSGKILDFEIQGDQVIFFIEWLNFPPKKRIEEYSDIKIVAKEIMWENAPDLFDPFRIET